MTLPLTGAGPSAGTYAAKVLTYGPIAYWPLWEAAGGVAECQVNSAQNGAYTGVTLGQPGIGDGRTAPLFDGVNDFVDIYSAALSAAFNGLEGSIVIWAKVFNVGVWTDATDRTLIHLRVDGNNLIEVQRPGGNNNRILGVYTAGGTAEYLISDGNVQTGWFHLALTWSAAADEVKFYQDGVQVGGTQTVLGVWAGIFDNTTTTIGQWWTGGTFRDWHGYLAHAAVWAGTVLTPAQIADLAVL